MWNVPENIKILWYSPHQGVRSAFLPLESRLSCDCFHRKRMGWDDAGWLQVCHKRGYSFCLVHWNSYTYKAELFCKKPDHPGAAMLWGHHTNHLDRLLKGGPVQRPSFREHTLQAKEVSRWYERIIQQRLRRLQLHRGGEDWVESSCASGAWSDKGVSRRGLLSKGRW